MQSYNPHGARSVSLGSSLFARHYLGNHSIIFFSSGYLDVSVLRVGSHCWVLHLQCSRLSHSEIFGLSLVCSYPKLIAAYHVLHRLLVPRHPPYALIRFKYCITSPFCRVTEKEKFILSLLLAHTGCPAEQKLLSQYVKELFLSIAQWLNASFCSMKKLWCTWTWTTFTAFTVTS